MSTQTLLSEDAVRAVRKQMASFRPDLTKAQIQKLLRMIISSGTDPESEIGQDVWWAYQKALKKLK